MDNTVSPIDPHERVDDDGHLPASGEINPSQIPHDDPLTEDTDDDVE
jgi:hypothetical protein